MVHRTVLLAAATALVLAPAVRGQAPPPKQRQDDSPRVAHRTVEIDGIQVFYREAGSRSAPALLLLHGFPTSSHMFRNLIPVLSDEFHLIAPDYPGFGASAMPPREEFQYTFDNIAAVVEKLTERLGLNRFALYVQDYGAPIGYRIAAKHPERVTALVIQNGNAYDEGIDNDFWKPIKAYWKEPGSRELREALRPFTKLEATRWQYTHGARDTAAISPDSWFHDQYLLDRPGNADIQLDLFLSYGTNPPLYAEWQRYFREHQPPALIVWGKNDKIFPPAGAEPYRRDLKTIEYHILDTGHFALEEEGGRIAELMRGFLRKHAAR